MSTVRPSLTIHGVSDKVRLLLEQLDSRYHGSEVDSGTGQARSTSALAMRLRGCVRALCLTRVSDPRLPVANRQEH